MYRHCNTALGRDGPGLLRRLAAIAYDSLLLCGILLVAALPLPLVGEAIGHSWWLQLLIQAYLISVCLLFFGWFWVHGGQTLGMRAWRLAVIRADGGRITWRLAAARFAAAILSWVVLGLGFLWVLFDADKLAWHDRLSGTRLVLRPNAPRPKSSLHPGYKEKPH